MTYPSKDEILELLRLHEEWTATIGASGQRLEMENLDLSGMDLSGKDLNGLELPGVNFSKCKLVKTDLYASWLGGALFVEADFTEGILRKAQVGGSNCFGCIMRNANLTRVSFYRSDLRRVDFSGADLFKTSMCGADLREANFSGADLDKASFREADLRGATGFETVQGERIGLEVDGEMIVLEGLDNIREWLFKASRL